MPDEPERGPERHMVSALITSLNDVITALRLEIKMLGDSERHGRKRTYAAIALVGFFVLVALTQLRASHAQGEDIKRLASYIEDCQNPDGECAQRNAERLGAAVRAVSVAVFDSVTCVLLQDSPTAASIQACRDQHFPP